MARIAAALLAVLLFLGPAAAQEETPPPETGQEAPLGPGEHRVAEGETLWDLAARYYGNPFQWPVIYNANVSLIANPHRIFPGQVIRIPNPDGTAEVVSVEVTTPEAPSGPVPGIHGRTIFYADSVRQNRARPGDSTRTSFYSDMGSLIEGAVVAQDERPRLAMSLDVFYSTGWLEPEDLDMLGSDARLSSLAGGSGASRRRVMFGDRVQVDSLPTSYVPGDQIVAFRLGRRIRSLGWVAIPTGLLTVVERAGANALVSVSREFGHMELGNYVVRAPEFPLVKGMRPVPVTEDQSATILAFQIDHEVNGLGDVAFLDMGADDGITVGDEFVAMTGEGDGWAGEIGGLLQVVRVRPGTASARVVRVTAPVLRIGLPVNLAGRMGTR